MKVIDLFSGAGGLSLGAARGGFTVAAAAEIDPFAMETHIKNFPLTHHIQKDVSTISGNELLTLGKLKIGELGGLVGGPPCQGFSTMGKQDPDDLRNNLFIDFFRLVRETTPLFFLAENVPGILDEKYDPLRNKAFSLVRDKYTILQPLKVKASDVGAPTIRTRIFFIGFNNSLVKNIPDQINLETKTSTIIKEALSGLPIKIDPTWQSEEQGNRKLFDTNIANDYFYKRLIDHIPQNVGHSETIHKLLDKQIITSCQGTRHTPEVQSRYARLKYNEVDRISKSVRLNPEGLCPTLRAGTGSDKGSYQAVRPIHYIEPRVITPREAARLQGFPDWFVFHKTKWHSFRQIGNSVSPFVSEAIFKEIFSILNKG
ncbi:DNA cytosine methyltransferase [Salmonella enterica subsp. salamae]|uniref:DNA cytosine methyltransferase n=1 Tax=Salmonella enterica TaxID=28901 RepID=UPI0003EB38FA|nr:DNA cytosine methyltransferase [Salmonella enterica]EAA6221731.1 DNA (cytosine-5-)-methyltransferase [Salmonella enterica subsp. salamae]EBZ2011924.1 DNA cytosine methyltransferase [Salmonella enterica subsp. enterica serovar Newport]ECF6083278.1 DNA cytosine methyltransferase [Salmonella enterica subsp. houtenae]EHG6069240.1 DNA cytosine methyltransferase [Salmonella enterica subsp. diarizonae serovar 61:z52:z53]MDD8672266.1 DNA cytosine methyltransferase [Escherichia coli]